MFNIDTVPLEIGEKMTKELDCETLFQLSQQVPSAGYHYNIKCKPSNFRKDLKNYFASDRTFLKHVLKKIAMCYYGKMNFIRLFIEWLFRFYLKYNTLEYFIYQFTSSAADELCLGRVNMQTVVLLDLLKQESDVYEWDLDNTEYDWFQERLMNEPVLETEVEDLETETKYIVLENVKRYYFGRLVALASKPEPTILKFIEYTPANEYEQQQSGLEELQETFIIHPNEGADALFTRFSFWVSNAVRHFPETSEWLDKMFYDNLIENVYGDSGNEDSSEQYSDEEYSDSVRSDNSSILSRENPPSMNEYTHEDGIISVFIAEVIGKEPMDWKEEYKVLFRKEDYTEENVIINEIIN